MLTTHVDTMVLRALLMPQEDPDMHAEARRRLQGAVDLPLRMSHVAVGEAFDGIASKERFACEGRDCALIEYNRLVLTRALEVLGARYGLAFHRMALELHRADDRWRPTIA